MGEDAKPVAPKKLKTMAAVLDAPPLPALSLRFAEWVARYSLAPLGMAVRLMMGAQSVFEPSKPRFGVRLVAGAASRRADAGARAALEVAADGQIRTKAALAAEAGCSTGVIDGLVAAGSLVEVAVPEKRFPRPDPAHRVTEFSDDQLAAVHAALGRRCGELFRDAARRRHRLRARPRSTSRRSRAHSRPASRRSSCCPRSR